MSIVLVLLGCRSPEVEVASVFDLGALETASSIDSREGGYSTRFGDRSIWVYGDTILGIAGEDGSSWRDNSWSWTRDLDPADGIGGFTEPVDDAGAPTELFEETEEEAAYNAAHATVECEDDPCGAREVVWPRAVVTDTVAEQMILFDLKIHGEPDLYELVSRGVGVAVWDDLEALPKRQEPGVVANDPTLLFGPNEPRFGGAAAIGPDTRLYAWGSENDRDGQVLGRVFPENAANRDDWRFWDGEGWTASVDDAKDVFSGAPQMSVHYDEGLGSWLAVYVSRHHLVLRTAPAPEGPWSGDLRLGELEEPPDGTPSYGMLHPEYSRDGVHLATYYRATGDWKGEIRLLEVTLEAR